MLRKFSFGNWDEALQLDSIDKVLDWFEIRHYSSTDDERMVEIHLPIEAREEDHRRPEFMEKATPRLKERLEKYEPVSRYRIVSALSVYIKSYKQPECLFRILYPSIYGAVAYAENNINPPGLLPLLGALVLCVEPAILLFSKYKRDKSRELLEDAKNRINVVYEEHMGV